MFISLSMVILLPSNQADRLWLLDHYRQTLHGRKELITIKDSYQELEAKLWAELINHLLIIA
ncbi:MAG: hypothetical protein ACTS77_04030 [Arsenophonus sp. NC-TX2-MAG3]